MARPDSWFRFYNATLDNPKAQRLPGELFKSWVNILCLASRSGGTLPGNGDVAFALRIDETAAETLLATLRERGLLDWAKGVYSPHDWADLQFVSDSSTDRVKRYRDRHKKQARNVSGNENGTAQEESRTEQTIGDSPKAPKGAALRTEDFEKAYEAYPLKVAPNRAAKAFANAMKTGVSLQTILDGIERYKKNKPTEQAWAHFATWLNDGRWQDGYMPAVAVDNTADSADLLWKLRVDGFDRNGFWNRDQWGPAPNEPNCQAPTRLLENRKPNADGLDIPPFLKRTA